MGIFVLPKAVTYPFHLVKVATDDANMYTDSKEEHPSKAPEPIKLHFGNVILDKLAQLIKAAWPILSQFGILTVVNKEQDAKAFEGICVNISNVTFSTTGFQPKILPP